GRRRRTSSTSALRPLARSHAPTFSPSVRRAARVALAVSRGRTVLRPTPRLWRATARHPGGGPSRSMRPGRGRATSAHGGQGRSGAGGRKGPWGGRSARGGGPAAIWAGVRQQGTRDAASIHRQVVGTGGARGPRPVPDAHRSVRRPVRGLVAHTVAVD